MTRAVRDRILKDVNGNIHDHIRNHIHLTNCIHLKNHMHMKHSPIIADRALMRDLIFLQRSKSLRDPSASPHSSKMAGKNEPVTGSRRSSGDRNPRMSETSPRQVSKDKSFETEDESDHAALSCSNNHKNRARVEKYSEEGRNNINRPKRRRFRGSRRARAPPSVDKRDISGGAHNEISVASNSFGHGENRDNDKFDLQNGCGKIPWNWSRIHDRGKSILDMAGRSISCGGMSETRLKKEHGSNMLEISQNSSSSSTKKSDGQEALPLLLDGSQGSGGDRGAATWLRDYSGELGLYADDLLDKNEIDSDHKKYNNGRHQNITQKYAPRTFRDLVGQNLVVQALSNAIIKRKIGLMYLFHGPHGTGKTSCARIFARALNCHSLEHPKPCGLCSSCARDRNVREIGPVSNVDFERLVDLLDKMVGPTRSQSQSRSQYKVLIFDECDTLSSECWSAVLKATDRAPRRVVFVLVCSSFEALPHVIISRCQKFYFPKLKDADVIYTLQWIASKEDLEIDKDALKLIASRSDGSLRDAEMTLEQLSLLGKRISLGLVQELVGLISDEKLVDLLDLALSADTVNTVKNLRDIMESGVEPLALMSQLATVITDILAGSYDFAKEGSRRKFFRRNALSKEDMEKLRQALKTLSEAEKQLRLSNDRITWLTAALLQLAPDQQYILPSSSADTSYHHSPTRKPRKSNAEMSKGTTVSGNRHDRSRGVTNDQLPGVFRKEEIEEIWFQVLEKIPINTVREFMYREGKLISVSYGAAPTVQLLFTSQLTKSKAEKFRLHVLQAFESVLKSPVTIEIRCEPKTDPSSRTILLPGAQNPTTHLDVGPSRTEIVELEASPPQQESITRERRGSMVNSRSGEGTSTIQKISSLLGEGNAPSLSIVRRKMSLAHVIQHAEAGGGSQQQLGGWSRRKAVSIAEKLEQENLRLEPRSRRLLCWNPPKATRRKLSRLKIRTRKPQALMKYVSCGKCLSGGSPRTR